jgi:polyphosphate kinase 2 (PPK2 family)
MLETLDLHQRLARAAYKSRMRRLQERLRELQYAASAAGQAIIICLEGWEFAEKGELIRILTEKLDPRIFRIHPESEPTPLEKRYHFLWRYQVQLPAYGEMGLFEGSWYGRVLAERCTRTIAKHEWREAFEQINQFERWLTDEGQLVLKFWVHISKSEQKRRMRAARRDPALSWKLNKRSRRQHRDYKRWTRAIEEMLARTGSPHALWTVIEGTDTRWARARFLETIVEAVEKALASRSTGRHQRPAVPTDIPMGEARRKRDGAGRGKLSARGRVAERA